METIADYFAAAFKQYANLVNNDCAKRYGIVITSAIGEELTDKKRAVYFANLPAGLAPSKQRFYLKLTDWRPKYSNSSLPERIAKRLSLSDEKEVEALIVAYFKTIKELVEPAVRIRLSKLIPTSLTRLYTQA